MENNHYFGTEKVGRLLAQFAIPCIVKSLLKMVVAWTFLVCLVCTVLFEAIPQVFIRMFGADGALYTQFALIIFTCVQKVCAIFLQSIGHAKAAAPLSVLRDVFLIIFSLVVPMFLGVTGIFWAAPASDILAIVITAAVMAGLWKELSAAEQKKENRVLYKNNHAA